MQVNFSVLTLCLLGVAVLCAASTIDPTDFVMSTEVSSVGPSNSGPTTSITDAPSVQPEATTAATPGPSNSGPTTSNTDAPSVQPEATTAATPGPVGEGSSELSPGAIAGIAIGSIAGAAALGGGIFGALRYAKKI